MSHIRTPRRVRRRLWALPLLSATALIAAGAGCGGDDDEEALTKAEVISRGTTICEEARRSVDALPQPSEDPFAKGASAADEQRAREFLVGQAAAFRSVSDGFQELDAPEPGRDLLDGFIRDMETVWDKLKAASGADAREAEAEADEAYSYFGEAGEKAAAYGFPKGACGVGGDY